MQKMLSTRRGILNKAFRTNACFSSFILAWRSQYVDAEVRIVRCAEENFTLNTRIEYLVSSIEYVSGGFSTNSCCVLIICKGHRM
jgi:hypothetical protein